MRIAIVGAGRMGGIRAEDLSDHVDELLIANRTQERAVELAGRCGGRAVALDDLMDHDVDGYVMATATSSHLELLERLVEMRKPILCEKPIALTLEHTKAIMRRADDLGTPLQIGFQRRYDSEIAQAQRMIADGSLGTLYVMHLLAHDHQPSTVEFLQGSGGIFRDLHVHDFDLIRWMTASDIASVYATKAVRAHNQYSTYDDADVSLVHVVTESGVQATVSGARHDPVGHDVHMEIFGSADSISVGLNHRTPLRPVEGDLALNVDPYSGFIDRFRDAFRRETLAFTRLVSGEIANPCPPDSALEALRAAIACELSIALERPVALTEVVTVS